MSNATEMVEIEAVRDSADDILIGEPVGGNTLSVPQSKRSVAARADIGSPQPTPVRPIFVDLAPKANARRNGLRARRTHV